MNDPKPSEKTAIMIENGEGRKRLHKAVQNVLYNEVGISREQFEAKMEEIIERRVDHYLATHNMDTLLLNHIASAIKTGKWQERYYHYNIKTLAQVIADKVNEVVREKVSTALKGLKIEL